jgi:hypothetical protein
MRNVNFIILYVFIGKKNQCIYVKLLYITL